MSNRRTQQETDEFLAANTDCILAGIKPESSDISGMSEEETRLMNTVEQLARLKPETRAEAEMRNRIRARLSAQWNVSGPGASPKRSTWQVFETRKMTFAWGMLGLLALLIVGILASPAVIPPQSGAAVFHPATLAAGIIILGILALVFWLNKRKP